LKIPKGGNQKIPKGGNQKPVNRRRADNEMGKKMTKRQTMVDKTLLTQKTKD